jgi:type II secretory pathway component PulF
MRVYEAQIRTPNGGLIRVRIEAESQQDARQLLEAQYGADAIFTGPG